MIRTQNRPLQRTNEKDFVYIHEQNYQLGGDKHHVNVVNGTNLDKYTLVSAVSLVENDQPLFKTLTQMKSLYDPSVHTFYRSVHGTEFEPAGKKRSVKKPFKL